MKTKFFWPLFILIPVFVYLILQNKFLASGVLKVMGAALIVYLILAISHHLKEKSLTLEVILEYLLIAVLAMVVLINF